MSNNRSFECVHYMLRPKKQIERKIILDILNEIHVKFDLNEYLYLGFGSIFYYDFILCHKYLNIDNFHSIDDKSTEKRFKFNRPYDFIDFDNKLSTKFLETYDWDQKTIMWLDYDGPLSETTLADLKLIAKNGIREDVVIITLNAYCPAGKKRRKEQRESFYQDYGRYVSPDINKKKYFTPKLFPNLLQDILTNYLESQTQFKDINFNKLFAFKYSDNAPMFTIGWLLDKKDEFQDYEWDYKFIRTDSKIIEIDVPVLTYNEKFYLDAHIDYLKEFTKLIDYAVENEPKLKGPKAKKEAKDQIINDELPFELPSFEALINYLEFHRLFPQYYEGII